MTSFKTAESPFKSDNTASGKAGVTLMNTQVGAVVADVMNRQDYGKMIHMDDRTVMFGSLEEAAAFIGDMLPPEVAKQAIHDIEEGDETG